MRQEFIAEYNHVANMAYTQAVVSGAWNVERCKALDSQRDLPGFSQLESRLAGVIIWIMDFGIKHRPRIAEAVLAKVGVRE